MGEDAQVAEESWDPSEELLHRACGVGEDAQVGEGSWDPLGEEDRRHACHGHGGPCAPLGVERRHVWEVEEGAWGFRGEGVFHHCEVVGEAG